VSSTLEQLYSGLKSFKFHLDWIQHEQDKLDIDYSKTKNSHLINLIDRVLKQVRRIVQLTYNRKSNNI